MCHSPSSWATLTPGRCRAGKERHGGRRCLQGGTHLPAGTLTACASLRGRLRLTVTTAGTSESERGACVQYPSREEGRGQPGSCWETSARSVLSVGAAKALSTLDSGAPRCRPHATRSLLCGSRARFRACPARPAAPDRREAAGAAPAARCCWRGCPPRLVVFLVNLSLSHLPLAVTADAHRRGRPRLPGRHLCTPLHCAATHAPAPGLGPFTTKLAAGSMLPLPALGSLPPRSQCQHGVPTGTAG